MCARPLSCPLCSQPGFVTLDALRAGLVSVATRPLACPVCNETLLGIDKLTIHLFGHTISANNRSDTRKVTDINGTNGAHEGNKGEAMIPSQNWNPSGNHTILCERIQTKEATSDKVFFVPLANLNSDRSVTAIVINKDPDSSSSTNSQGYSTVSETTEKNQSETIFVANSSQRQQFFSPRLIRTNISPATNASGQETYRSSVPMVFHSLAENKSVPLVVPLQNSLGDNSTETGGINRVGICQRSALRENSSVNETEQKVETEDQFSETWIENLFQEDSEECNASCRKSSTSVEKSYSSQTPLNLSNEEEKFSNYHRVAFVKNKSTDGKESRLSSQDSSLRRSEEMSNRNNQSSPNSIDVLPQLKALRLLATKDKTERCNICGILVPDRNILVLHKQVVHMIAEKDVNAMPEELLKNYPCHFCTKIFKNRGSLMVHMRIAHIGYNFGLEAGSLSKETESEFPCCENGYNCPTCGKNFRKEQHVTQHLKTHDGKQWECDVCSKMFTTKYFLKKHKRLHSGEMPYKCTLCDKTFTFQQSYHKHRLYHKDDKPHTCATCGRSFKELSTLHNHERIHTGEKPFVCETCGKCFRQRVSYLVHRRIHTGVMPYKCVACGKNFRYKVSQRTHKCPVQPEDSSSPVPETASTNAALPSLCNDSSTVQRTGILIQNQGISEISTNDNKFILVVNTQGQPVLTRESDVSRGCFISDKRSNECPNDEKVSQDDDNDDLWNNLSVENVSKDSTSSPTPVECTTVNEKLLTSSASDFFSLVMSPLENDLSSSPSTEMEHLRLSSPRNDDARQNDSRDICDTNSGNILQSDLNNAIDGIFRDNCSGNGPLETINEESLKQLLYGIDRKV